MRQGLFIHGTFNLQHLAFSLTKMVTCDTTVIAALPGWDGCFDENLTEASRIAFETGSVSPLVKEELKCVIQSRRIAQGKDELQVAFQGDKKYELTAEEVEKVEKRKEQNKMAARRFRQRQKDASSYYIKKIQILQSTNTNLKYELTKLKQEKSLLEDNMQAHLLHCPGNFNIDI